jgi:hypothetical protein
MLRSRTWLLLAAWGLVAAAAGSVSAQTAQEPPAYGEVIDVRTGFVRVTLPKGAPAPRVEDIEVTWKGQPQKVLRVIGGTAGPLELGIAVDRSASMHASFELMRAATLNLVDQGISEQDRVFSVAFTDETRLLAEGRGEAAKVIAALPSTPELGTRPTALFQALTRTLQLFENADARAALLVVSDGCDTAGGLVSATSVARRASDLAIPVFLLMPDRNACRNTVCQLDAAGKWRCTPDATPGLMHGASNDMFNPAARPTAMSESAAFARKDLRPPEPAVDDRLRTELGSGEERRDQGVFQGRRTAEETRIAAHSRAARGSVERGLESVCGIPAAFALALRPAARSSRRQLGRAVAIGWYSVSLSTGTKPASRTTRSSSGIGIICTVSAPAMW